MASRTASRVPHLAFAIDARRRAAIGFSHSLRMTIEPHTRTSLSTKTACKHATTSARSIPRPTPNARTMRRLLTEEEKEPKPTFVAGPQKRSANIYIWASCIFGFTVSLYIFSSWTSHRRAVKATTRLDLPQNADVSNRWRDSSRNFDEEVDLSEKWLLLRAKRKRLVNQCYGEVLEVSCGTGRNMDLYDLRPFDEKEDAGTGRSRKRIIRGLTFNDQSEIMVDRAKGKFEEMEERKMKGERFMGEVRFVVGDAGVRGLIERPRGGYDTIVQTMGVCSARDAAGLLKRLGDLCRQPGEEGGYGLLKDDDGKGGRILLLEHGRGRFDWINRLLDDGAKMHAAHYGCWWNKDVQEVIEESGLVVERIRRYNLGTTWEIVLRPSPK